MTDQEGWPPLLMAGPVVRRGDESAIHIWLATSRPAEIRAAVYAADLLKPQQPKFRPSALGKGQTGTVELGRNLHVGLVAIHPAGQNGTVFHSESIVAYDLVVYPAGQPDGKATAGPRRLLDLAPDITYPDYSLPTVILPSKGGPTNILHGSCRKLHGPSEDLLQVADGLLASSIKSLTRRPTALFLTGDQIYADDVADEIISHIVARATDLLGFKEAIPLSNRSVRAVATIPGGDRGQLVKDFFTPDYPNDRAKSTARNHMLGFGEFCVLYLLSLHEAHWPAGALSAELEATRAALPKIRRVLANIPTYMICDDHEITDDWNFNGQWHARAYNHPTGRRVIANGLAAYWAFQSWGNKPDTFGTSLAQPIAQHITTARRQATGPSPDQDVSTGPAFESLLLAKHWGFEAPTSPPAVFIDSRTNRGFARTHRGQDTGLPMLLSLEGIEELGKTLDNVSRDGRPLLIIATTPVFGNPAVELSLTQALYFRTAEEVDREWWRANPEGFNQLVWLLAAKAPQGCIILSGDVHYAFGVEVRVTGAPSMISMFQFTSSSLKNHPLAGSAAYNGLESDAQKPPQPHIDRITAQGQRLVAASHVAPIESGRQLYDGNNLGQLLIEGGQLTMHFHTYDNNSTLKTFTLTSPIRQPHLR